jgi:hypothetical protein
MLGGSCDGYGLTSLIMICVWLIYITTRRSTANLKSHPRKHSVMRFWAFKIKSESESYVTTDGQSASLSWYKAPIRGLRPDFCYWQTVAGLLMWGALSDERTCLSFTTVAGPRHRSHFRLRVPWNYCLRFFDLKIKATCWATRRYIPAI